MVFVCLYLLWLFGYLVDVAAVDVLAPLIWDFDFSLGDMVDICDDCCLIDLVFE